MSKKIIPANKAPELLFELLFKELEALDELRSEQGTMPDIATGLGMLLEDALTFDPKVVSYDGDVELEDPDGVAREAKGFLDDNEDRIWSSPCGIHSCCWIAHITGFMLAFKDGLAEIKEACYPRSGYKNPYGKVATRSKNWKSKSVGRPPKKGKKKPAFQGQRGRPASKDSKWREYIWNDAARKRDQNKRARKSRAKKKRKDFSKVNLG